MKTFNRISLMAILGSALLLSACGGDSDVVSSPDASTGPGGGAGAVTLPPPGPAVPGAAGSSVSSFIAYLTGLSAVEEKAEPSPIADNFAVPDNETSEPQVLS